MMSATEMNFGPDWLRALSDGAAKGSNSNSSSNSLTNSISSNSSQSRTKSTSNSSGHHPHHQHQSNHPVSKYRYSFEEMLLYYNRSQCTIPDDLAKHEEVYVDEVQDPVAFVPITTEEFNLLSQNINCDSILKKAAKEANGTVFGGSDILAAGGISEVRAKLINSAVDLPANRGERNAYNNNNTNSKSNNIIGGSPSSGVGGGLPGGGGLFNERLGGGSQLRRGSSIGSSVERTGTGNVGLSNRPPGFRNSLFSRVSSYDESSSSSASGLVRSGSNSNHPSNNNQSAQNSTNSGSTAASLFSHSSKPKSILQRNYSSSIDSTTGSTSSAAAATAAMFVPTWRQNSTGSGSGQSTNSGTTGAGFAAAVAATLTTSATAASATAESNKSNEWRSTSDTSKNWRVDGSSSGGPKILASSYKTSTGAASAAASKDFDIDDPSGPAAGGNYWDNVQRKRNSKTASSGNKPYGRGGGVRSFDSDYNDLFKTFDAPLDMLDAERDLFGSSGGSSTAAIAGTNSPAGNSRSFGGNLQPNYSELFSGTRGGKQPPGFTRFSRDRSNNANDYGKEYESGNTKPWNKSTSSWNSSDNRYSLSNRNHYHSGGGGYHNNNSQHQYGNPRSHNNNNNYDGEHDEGQHDRRGSLPEWSLEDPSSIDVTRVGSFDASGAFHEAPFDEDGSIGGALEDDDDEVDDKDKMTRDNSRKTSKDQKTMKSDNNKSSTTTAKTSLKNVENQKKKMAREEEDSSRKDSLSDNQPRVSASAAAAAQSSTRGEIVDDDEEAEAEKTAKQELKYELEKMLQQFSNNNNLSDTQQQQQQQQQENTILQKGGRLDPSKTNPSHQMTNNSASSSVNTPKIDYFNFNDDDNESNDKSYNQQQHNNNNSQQHSGGFGANDNHHHQQQQMIDKDNFLHNHHRQQQQQHDSFAQMVQQQQKQQQSSGGGGQGSNDKFSSSMQNFSRENSDDNSNNNNSDILASSGDNHQGLLSNQFGKLLIDSNSSDSSAQHHHQQSKKQESLNLERSQQSSSSLANSNNKPNMRSEFLNERYLQQQQQLKAAANQAASQSQHVSSNNPQQQSQSSASLFEMLSNNNNEQSQQDPIIGQASIKQSSSLLDDNFGLASSFGSQQQHPHQQQSSMFSHLSKQCAEQPIGAAAQVGPVAFGELSSTNSDLMNSNSRLGLSNLMQSQQELKGPAPHLVKSQQQQLHNQLLIAEAQKWYYCDPQGNIQGPFNAGEMCDWFASGYFSMELLVRRGCDQVFSKLGQLYQVCGNRAPFLPITPAQQQYLLSQPETAALGALIFPPPILANPPAPSSPPLSANNNNNPNFQPQQSQQPQHNNNFGPSNLDELNPQQQVRPQSDSLILGQMMQQRQQPAPPINPTVTQPSSASDISNLPGIGHPQNNMQAQAQLRFILDHLMKQELFRQLTTAQQHQIVLEKFLQMNGTNTSNSGNSQQRAVPVSVSSEPASFQSQQKQPVFGPQPTGHVSANIGDHQQQQGFGPQSIAHVPTNIVEHQQQQSHLDPELHHPQHHPHQNILDHHHSNLAHSRPNLLQQSPITTKNPLSFHQEQQLHHPPHHQQPQENSPSPPAQSPAATALGPQLTGVAPKPSALQIIQSAMAAAAGQQQHLTTTEVSIPQQQQAPISIGNSQSVSQTLQPQPLPPVQGSVPWETIVPGALSLSAVEEMQRREAEERFIRLQQKQAAEIGAEPSETTTHKSSKEEQQQQTQQRSNNKTPKSAAKQAKAAAKQQKTEPKPEPQQAEPPKQLPTTRLHEPQHSPSPSQPSQQPLVIPEMPQLPKKSVWGNPTLAEVQPAAAQPQSTQSIAEIQKLQEEKEREEEERKRQALQQQQQMASFIAGQQQNSASGIPFKWATQQWQTEQSPKIKTLAEIQAEEAAQLAILRKQQAEAEARRRQANNNAVGTPLSVIVAKGGAGAAGGNASGGGVWNNSSSSQLFTNNTGGGTSSPKTTGSVGVGFWEDDDPPLPLGQISLTNFKNALNMSGKAKVDGPFLRQLLKSNPKNVKKLEESQLMKLGIETSDDLYRYSVDILSKSFEQIDAQSFISIIKDLGSPNEVIEYIQCFLGNNQSAMYFAKFFISKKSYLFNKSKQEAAAAGQTKQSHQSKSQQHQQSNQRSGGIWDDDDDEEDHQNSADQEYDDYEGGGNDGNDYYDDYESYTTPAVSTSNRHVQQQRNQQTGSSYKSALNQNLSAQQQKQQQSTHNNKSAVQSSPAKSSQQAKAKNIIINNSSVHQSPKSTKNVEPQDSSALMTAAVESMRDFDNWCIEVLKQNFELDIDAETFVSFLKDIDSPFEINEYVSTYLGNCRASRDFGKNFIAKRSYLRNKAKQEQYEDMCGPAPAITPSVNSKLDSSVMNSAQSLGSGSAGDNTGFVTVSSSSKKKRKGPKKQSADQ